ncbi:MAG: hypothetical protein WDZ76_04600 [Pseudohongiellaceae bacterium]
MTTFWLSKSSVKSRTYIPKFYDPQISITLAGLRGTHDLLLVRELVECDIISVSTGHEIGKLAYGTGDIPFVRTSDISNWEIKSAPKQGVSEEIYSEYAARQNVEIGDILVVRDGTYLIGTNCIVTTLDGKILYQSHILKIRAIDQSFLDPFLFFIALNSSIVQSQIRSFQFTADTIDTIGNRYLDLVIPLPKDQKRKKKMGKEVRALLEDREIGKAFIKQAPILIEKTLCENSINPIETFLAKEWDEILTDMTQGTITAEFGHFETFWLYRDEIKERIYLPKYYDPEISDELDQLHETCTCLSLGTLLDAKVIQCSTGDEIGKMAYGTGSIPFLRTSDFSNWEIKHDPKQGVSKEIFYEYMKSQDVKVGDILLVRDGTYLIGTSCIVTDADSEMLFCGGLYKIRVIDESVLNPWLLLGLLNSYIVKRQIRTKQFTRDVIDTIGRRLYEVILPIPKDVEVREKMTEQIKKIVLSRISARQKLSEMSEEIVS